MNKEDPKEAERLRNKAFHSETVTMDENGHITVSTIIDSPDGTTGEGSVTVKPGDSTYDKCLEHYSPLKPGDFKKFSKRWINGKWQEVDPLPSPSVFGDD